jgi:ribose-phosphate pyrophosphokinase
MPPLLPTLSLSRGAFTESIGAADAARMLETVGCDRVISMDLHNGQLEGFFSASTPTSNLVPYVAAIPYFAKKRLARPVVVSPSANGVYRAKMFRDSFARSGVEARFAGDLRS